MEKFISLLITDVPETLETGETKVLLMAVIVGHALYSTPAFEKLYKDNYSDN
jgi:hypothetical protein